jgi:hypothetical protein
MIPRTQHQILTFEVPPTGKKRNFRPMLVREEKLLLMAKDSEDDSDIFSTVKQVVQNCCLDEKFDVGEMPLFALEYLFLKLRGASVGNEITVSYRDGEDGTVYPFRIDLKGIGVRYPAPEVDSKILTGPKSGFVLRYPQAKLYDDKPFLKVSGDESFYRLVARCVEKIFDGDTVCTEFTEEELLDYIDNLEIQTFEKVKDFMSNLPGLYKKLEYRNKNGRDVSIELRTLSDFFTLR